MLINKNKSKSLRYGFTLIEFVVVIGILTVVIGTIMAFIFGLLKGNNQSNVDIEVKQNGQIALNLLEKQIRNADIIECYANGTVSEANCLSLTTGTDYIKIKPKVVNYQYTSLISLHIKCFNSEVGVANGWIGVVEQEAYPADELYKSITNTNTISGVDISDCKFNVFGKTSSDTFSNIKFSFVANQGVLAPSRADFKANAKFETTITLRNN